MKLSKRLKAIYDLVNSPCILADIGCDHALLPIALVEGKKCEKVYACDVNEGPLSRGREAIARYGYDSQIKTVLTNGLHDVPKDITTITIAGMGWETITAILSNDLDKAYACKQLILQSNNHIDDLRRWLSEHDFIIDAEDLVFEQHYYHILSVHPGTQTLDETQIKYGLYLDHHPLYQEYWQFVLHKKELILANLDEQHPTYPALLNDINDIKEHVFHLS